MNNLFSSFDPRVSVLGMYLGVNWVSCLLPLILIPQSYWSNKAQSGGLTMIALRAIKFELSAIFGSAAIPGVALLFMSFFVFIVTCNFAGLFPYVFTPSSHMSMTLGLSLPLWVGTMVWSLVFQYNSIMAHLVPLGTPPLLMPVMVVIETVSSVIRPLTLAVRLAANMVAGHLLLTLLGSQGPQLGGGGLMVLVGGLTLLLMLECAVACIQAYVFTILSSLYLNELLSTAFNKKMS